METIVQTRVPNGAMAPYFELAATGGTVVSPWTYKEQKNLVAFFLDSVLETQSRFLLERLLEWEQRYSDHDAEILVISQDSIEVLGRARAELKLPFLLLSDFHGTATAKYKVGAPAVFVIDRFGEVFWQSEIDKTVGPEYRRILDALELIELECPECGVTTWVA